MPHKVQPAFAELKESCAMKRKCAVFAACVLLLILCSCQGKQTGQNENIPSAAPAETPGVTAGVTQTASPAPETVPPETDLPVESSPEPTTEPTAEPAPETTPAPSAAPEKVVSPEQLEAYFDDAVFIGDSIMEGVYRYAAKKRSQEPTLGSARFLTTTSGVSVAKLLEEEKTGPFYRYNGQSLPLLQILPGLECKRIFLQLGLNDMAEVNPVVEKSVEDYSRLIDLLQGAVPGAEVIVITNPPKVASQWLPDYTPNRSFGNGLIAEFVAALIQMCDDRGIAYVDVYAALRNGDGALPDNYCSDGFVHLNDAGAGVVVEELYRFAAERVG